MKIFIQNINVCWSKESRGMPGAKKRNSIPEKFVLQFEEQHFLNEHYYVQELFFDEWDKFEIRERTWKEKIISTIKFDCIEIESSINGLKVIYCHDPRFAGAPIRPHSSHLKTVFELKDKQTGQIIYNGRKSELDNGEWIYRKKVCNIAFSNSYNSNIFANSKFDYVHKDLADLL